MTNEKRDPVDLHRFFNPKGVAIIGAIERSLDEYQTRRRYDALYGADNWYLVSVAGGSIGDIPISTDVTNLPPFELAVITAPPGVCPDLVEQCGERGARFAIVVSSGFSEVGSDGAVLEERLVEAGRRSGVRILGPNTNTNAFERQPAIANYRFGKIGVVTQSGHNGRPLMQGAVLNIAFSRQVPCGNECDLDVCDFIEYFADDVDTQVIAGYIEGFRDVARLRRALECAHLAGKPVVLLKIGSTEAGRSMAASHTGHMTGEDAAVDGLFRQYNVVRVRDLDELLEVAALMAKVPNLPGRAVALYAISGGSGTLMAEQAERSGLSVPPLEPETQMRLHEVIPTYLRVSNPVDNGGNFVLGQPAEVRRNTMHEILDDPNVDVLAISITPMPPMSNVFCEDIVEVIASGPSKPIVVSWSSPKTDEPGYELLVERHVPLFRSFRNMFGALALAERWTNGRVRYRPRSLPQSATEASMRALVQAAGAGVLDGTTGWALLDEAGVHHAKQVMAKSGSEAKAAAETFGGPVAMKVSSADLPHRSEHGLVRLGIADGHAADAAFETLIADSKEVDASARLDGVLVQEMVIGDLELIIGVVRDDVLGHAITIGVGGVYAELVDDTSVRPLPIDEGDVHEMLRELRIYPAFLGYRGKPALAVDALTDVALSVSSLVSALGDRLVELDLNPVIVSASDAVAVDSLIVLSS